MKMSTEITVADTGMQGKVLDHALDSRQIAKLAIEQYNQPLYAALREPITNACESHVMAGKADVPFDLIMDHDSLTGITSITVRDYGTGVDQDFLENGFFRLGHSTKRDTNEVGGAFGLGAKAAFAVSQGRVMSVSSYDGERVCRVTAYMAEDGLIRVNAHGAEPSTEPRGLALQFEVNTGKHSEDDWEIDASSGLPSFTKFLMPADLGRNSSALHYSIRHSDGLKVPGSEFVSVLVKALYPVGHPGSTYNAKPRLIVNGDVIPFSSIRDIDNFVCVSGLYSKTDKGLSVSTDAFDTYGALSSVFNEGASDENATKLSLEFDLTFEVMCSLFFAFKLFSGKLFWHNAVYDRRPDDSSGSIRPRSYGQVAKSSELIISIDKGDFDTRSTSVHNLETFMGSLSKELYGDANEEECTELLSYLVKGHAQSILFATGDDVFNITSDRMSLVSDERNSNHLYKLICECSASFLNDISNTVARVCYFKSSGAYTDKREQIRSYLLFVNLLVLARQNRAALSRLESEVPAVAAAAEAARGSSSGSRYRLFLDTWPRHVERLIFPQDTYVCNILRTSVRKLSGIGSDSVNSKYGYMDIIIAADHTKTKACLAYAEGHEGLLSSAFSVVSKMVNKFEPKSRYVNHNHNLSPGCVRVRLVIVKDAEQRKELAEDLREALGNVPMRVYTDIDILGESAAGKPSRSGKRTAVNQYLLLSACKPSEAANLDITCSASIDRIKTRGRPVVYLPLTGHRTADVSYQCFDILQVINRLYDNWGYQVIGLRAKGSVKSLSDLFGARKFDDAMREDFEAYQLEIRRAQLVGALGKARELLNVVIYTMNAYCGACYGTTFVDWLNSHGVDFSTTRLAKLDGLSESDLRVDPRADSLRRLIPSAPRPDGWQVADLDSSVNRFSYMSQDYCTGNLECKVIGEARWGKFRRSMLKHRMRSVFLQSNLLAADLIAVSLAVSTAKSLKGLGVPKLLDDCPSTALSLLLSLVEQLVRVRFPGGEITTPLSPSAGANRRVKAIESTLISWISW